MRSLPAGLATLATAAAVATACLTVLPGASANPGVARTAYPQTVRTTVRPVTADGQAAAGFTVHRQNDVPLDCSFAFPSPGAVSRNIEECSPSAAYAVACWKQARQHRALCTRDPRSEDIDSLRIDGKFAATHVAKPKDRAPLLLVLTDGTRCAIRDGGAWGSLKSHPNWYGSYSCSRHGVVWSPAKATHYGVDEAGRSWTVRTAPFNGRHLVVRHVRRAYFVGTAKA